MAGSIQLNSTEYHHDANPIHWGEKITYHNREWPKAFQETFLQTICRIAFDILSVIIFPIALIRLAQWAMCKLITPIVIPAAYYHEKIVDNLADFPQEMLSTSLTRHISLQLLDAPLESGEDFIDRLQQLGGDWNLVGEFLEGLKITLNNLHDGYSEEKASNFLNHLVQSLNVFPDEFLAQLFLHRVDLRPLDADEQECSTRLKDIFNGAGRLLRVFMSHETQAILKKVVLGQPNVHPMTLTTPDAEELEAIYVRNCDDPDASTAVYCNPNLISFQVLYDNLDKGYTDAEGRPFNYVYFNYRGVAESSGTPTPQGILVDSDTAVKAVYERFGVPRKKTVVVGWSLGGAAGNFAASQNQGEHPDGSDSVSCCNERSFSFLPLEIQEFLMPHYGCCVATIAANVTRWSGWNWHPLAWWRDIKGYKWVVVHPNDETIPASASFVKAWQEDHGERTVITSILEMVGFSEGQESDASKSFREQILEMGNSFHGHCRLFYHEEWVQQQEHMRRATQMVANDGS